MLDRRRRHRRPRALRGLVIPGVVQPIPVQELAVDDNGEPITAEKNTFVDDDTVALERVEAGQAIAVCDPFFDLTPAGFEDDG